MNAFLAFNNGAKPAMAVRQCGENEQSMHRMDGYALGVVTLSISFSFI
jgi:hypothetical protein